MGRFALNYPNRGYPARAVAQLCIAVIISGLLFLRTDWASEGTNRHQTK
jgi:hypothetical protein